MIHTEDLSLCHLCGAVTTYDRRAAHMSWHARLNARTMQPRDTGPDDPHQYTEWAAKRAEATREADHVLAVARNELDVARNKANVLREQLQGVHSNHAVCHNGLQDLRFAVERVADWLDRMATTLGAGAAADGYRRVEKRLRDVLAASWKQKKEPEQNTPTPDKDGNPA